MGLKDFADYVTDRGRWGGGSIYESSHPKDKQEAQKAREAFDRAIESKKNRKDRP